MVKGFVAFLLLFSFTYAFEIEPLEEVVSLDDPLTRKIKGFLDEESYIQNRDFIGVIFDPKSAFYKNERVDAVKVIQTLKENGLLKLFFESPKEFRLNFQTSGSPIFFVKIMGDTLRNIGYYRYVTTASNLDASEFSWSIDLISEYATDPLVLQKELQESGCNIIDIERNSAFEWSYNVDIGSGFLNIKELINAQKITLKRSLYAHWLNVAKIKNLKIKSSRRNHWYPSIAYYDASLHLVKMIKQDSVHEEIMLEIPKNAKYMKISDMYTLKNVRDELLLFPQGSR